MCGVNVAIMSQLNGMLNIIKPPSMTSHDVVACVKRIVGVKRCGHSGTLDPAAVGVLQVFVGKATRLIEYYEKYHQYLQY